MIPIFQKSQTNPVLPRFHHISLLLQGFRWCKERTVFQIPSLTYIFSTAFTSGHENKPLLVKNKQTKCIATGRKRNPSEWLCITVLTHRSSEFWLTQFYKDFSETVDLTKFLFDFQFQAIDCPVSHTSTTITFTLSISKYSFQKHYLRIYKD